MIDLFFLLIPISLFAVAGAIIFMAVVELIKMHRGR